MDFSKNTVICRFCLEKFTENCASIGKAVHHTLNFLTLYPNLTISDKPMICETCAASLTKCFYFKMKCLSIEDVIVSFAKSEVKKVDLRDIYSKVKQVGNIDRVPDDHIVCRFCLELANDGNSVSVKQDANLIELLQKYFVKMDLKVTDDILACMACYNTLQLYACFVNNYINIEERIDEYCKVEGLNCKGQVDLATFISKSLLNVEYENSVFIKKEKFEDIVDTNVDVKVKVEDLMDVKQEEELLNQDVQEENSNSFQHHPFSSQSDGEPQQTGTGPPNRMREIYGYQNNRTGHLQKRVLARKNTGLVTRYNCEICPYKTEKKELIRRHMVRHKYKNADVALASTDVEARITIHKCDQCDYETVEKSNLTRHALIHKSPSEVTMYECELCDYKAKWKSRLKQHARTHKNPSKSFTHKYDICTYEPRYNNYLQKHTLVRVDESEIIMHKCEVCPYVTRWRSALHQHLRTHKDTPDVVTEGAVYKSELCDEVKDETRYKDELQHHTLVHNDVAEAEVHKCDLCPFETKLKNALGEHLLTHSNTLEAVTESTMYKSELCDYEVKDETRPEDDLQQHMLVEVAEVHKTKLNTALGEHLFTHSNTSDVLTEGAMYKSELCDEVEDETRHKDDLQHHKDVTEIEVHKCDMCPFKTKWKSALEEHLLIHSNTPDTITEGNIYKPELCVYEVKDETRPKDDFQQHMLVHRDVAETEVHKCDLCPFKTKWKSALEKHLLTHSNTPNAVAEGTMHKRTLYDYETKQESNLKTHMPTHEIPTETTIYKCANCDYETKEDSNLKTHMLTHDTPSETYYCAKCDYKTEHKNDLSKHMLLHKDMDIHKCHVCPFQTKLKRGFNAHLRSHNLLSYKNHLVRIKPEVVHKCKLCDYKAKLKSSLRTHMLICPWKDKWRKTTPKHKLSSRCFQHSAE